MRSGRANEKAMSGDEIGTCQTVRDITVDGTAS